MLDKVDFHQVISFQELDGLIVLPKFLQHQSVPAFAYFSAGTTYPGPSPLSSTERLDYNNDTATASPKGPLNAAKYGSGMTGNATHGYVGGGGPAHGISTVERIDYSSDTDTAAVKGPLNQSTYMISAMSS